MKQQSSQFTINQDKAAGAIKSNKDKDGSQMRNSQNFSKSTLEFNSKSTWKQAQNKKINIALVSDFYYPFVGGVEIHIKQLATLLSKHEKIGKVIVITHKYQHHSSLMYTGKTNHHGFSVYYLNIHYNKQHMIIYPTFIFNFRTAAKILREQNIDIVHCHQTGSTLSLEYIFYARILGIRVILTQHSLYGFRSLADIHFNRVSRLFVPFCEKVIAVSKTTRNNIILRAGLLPQQVVVIPNGVSDIQHIKKKIGQSLNQNNQSKKPKIVKIISVGRMTYRRGTDLLIQILPQLCRQHKQIQILVVGDGIKRRALQLIIQKYNLYNQVRLLGIIVDHQKLLQKMAECDIFLNTPLTQSFGIALAEAAMLGLVCVSTNVGGVEQAIPTQCLFSSSTNPKSLLRVLSRVINKVKNQPKKSQNNNPIFKYPWPAVCQRTVELYQQLIQTPKISRKKYLLKAIKTCNILQIFFALLACFIGFFYFVAC